MKIAFVGSVALQSQGYDLGRKPGDWDIVGSYDDIVKYSKGFDIEKMIPTARGKKMEIRTLDGIVDAEIAWEDSLSAELLDLIVNDPETFGKETSSIIHASLDVCYMLKMTHRFLKNSPHFLKTMRDIQKMRDWGAKIRPEHRDFYERRLKATLDYGHPNLNQSKKGFFTDDVPYKYDHDSIHEAVSIFTRPAYTYYQKDDSEVLTSRKKFFDLPEKYRFAGVYEEACVLALERSQIPYPETNRKKSFDMALMKVCTSITSGWFREYAWEHYDQIQHMYDSLTRSGSNYVDEFNKALARGKIKDHAK